MTAKEIDLWLGVCIAMITWPVVTVSVVWHLLWGRHQRPQKSGFVEVEPGRQVLVERME